MAPNTAEKARLQGNELYKACRISDAVVGQQDLLALFSTAHAFWASAFSQRPNLSAFLDGL